MKRLLLTSALAVLMVPVAWATSTYINDGVVSIVSPPEVPPQIDATTFINNGTFFITNLYSDNLYQPPLPYATWDTLNWTNANQMAGDTGFRFDYFSSVGQTNGWSANFQNAGNVNPVSANAFGLWYMLVAATNINNKGTFNVGGAGLMNLTGRSLDLSRGIFGAVGNDNNDLAGVRDLYWGTGISTDIGAAGNVISSPFMPVTTIVFPPVGIAQYATIGQSLTFFGPCANTPCPNGFTTYIVTNQVLIGTNTTFAYDILFLRQTNSAISTQVKFGDTLGGPGLEKFVLFQAVLTNRATGALTTNRLYLDDVSGDWIEPILLQTPAPDPFYTFFAAARYRPYDFFQGAPVYSLTHTAPNGYGILPALAPTAFNPTIFAGTNFPTFTTNIAWAATLSAAAYTPDPTISGSTWTNVPGRIQFTASGPKSYLDLTWSKVDGQSYLLLSATNHFVGSTNASIVSPISDIYLASTNGRMAISNLTLPYCPRMAGEIQIWSGHWTNISTLGDAEIYSVTMVDSALNPSPASQIQNLSLRSTNVLVGDVLNIFGNALIDARNLTISTNAYNAPTPNGEINLTSGALTWSAGFPTLVNLTNCGKITSPNSIFFGGARMPPWFTGTYDEPYQSFVTHGLLQSQGNSIWANYFEASGTNDSGVGPVSVQATSAIVTNGTFLVTDADISFNCGSLLISNQFLNAGRSIRLTVTNYLDDGSLSNSVDAIKARNFWTDGGGLNLLALPPQASLLATSVTNTAYPNAEVDNYWAGLDVGNTPSGFVNNAALGRLVLNGGDQGSLFAFFPTGAANALYVDLLELKGATATNFDVFGNSAGIYLAPNFNIYYGGAVWNGKDISEQINGRYGFGQTNGGQFLWVSNFNTGFFSSTNVTYTDGSGTHRFNRALVSSCDIDSNGNGIYNCMDPNPIPVFSAAALGLKAVYTNKPARSVLVSWNTMPLASNYLYACSSPLGASNQWQLVTNFLSSANVGARVSVTDTLKTNTVRYYRVRVVSP